MPADRSQKPWQGPEPELNVADAAAVDAVLGREPGVIADPQRQARLKAMARLLDQVPTPQPSDDLVEKTLVRIAATKPWTQRLDPLRLPAVPFSLAEIGAIAAMIIVGFSLVLPVLVRNRAEARRIACQSNLALAGMAMDRYAGDFGGYLPRGDVRPGSPWYHVGQAQRGEPVESNSAHLFLLARHGYISPQTLNCPENAYAPVRLASDASDWPTAEAVGFSYQNQYAARALRAEENPGLAILADRNPLFVIRPGEALQERGISANSSSLAHGGRGQNVLVTAGQADWRSVPVMPGGDNIWLPNGRFGYSGTETPGDGDAFLVP